MLDSGGVDAVAPLDERRRARLRVLREQGHDFVMPAAVLAEGVFSGRPGHDHAVRRLLALVDVSDVDAATGHDAGALRQSAIRSRRGPAPSGVDAIVVAEADRRAGTDHVRIVTGHAGDLAALASYARNAQRLSLLPP